MNWGHLRLVVVIEMDLCQYPRVSRGSSCLHASTLHVHSVRAHVIKVHRRSNDLFV